MTITYSNREPCICFDILVIGDRYYLRGITKSITILKPKNKCGALRNLLTFVQFKTCKYPWRSATFSNFIKSNTPPWVLFRLYKWYQTAQSVSNIIWFYTSLFFAYFRSQFLLSSLKSVKSLRPITSLLIQMRWRTFLWREICPKLV